MIDKNIFLKFISENFKDDQLYIDKFKPELWFVNIDCFSNEDYKLALVISDEDIRFSTIDKKPALDFSLYDFVFEENKEAEIFIKKVLKKGNFPKR